MNIEFATQNYIFTNKEPGLVEEILSQSFSSDIKSVQVSLQGFTLNYEHEHEPTGDTDDHHEHEHDEHIACVDLEVVLINGKTVQCKASAKTPKEAKVIERRVKVLFIATT